MKPFKLSFIIENNPDLVLSVLKALRNDYELSKTFEGSIKNGIISGTFSMLALINGMVIGFLKVEGVYSKEKGELTIEIKPNMLYWILQVLFTSFLLSVALFSKEGLVSIIILIVFSSISYLVFYLESKTLLNKLNRLK